MKYITLIFLCSSFLLSFGQIDTSRIKAGTDTLFFKLLNSLPKNKQTEIIEEYNKMSIDQRKSMFELMDVVMVMPLSSKKQLIQNIETNYSSILALKTFFKSIVPTGYLIYIEFKPPEKILNLDDSIDFWVYRKDKLTKRSEIIFQEWNVELKSGKLDTLLKLANLKRDDLTKLKKYLEKANCISVSNDNEFEIGFAKSGMGKYSYLLFDRPLAKEDQNKYNNGCEYIFYKGNIVLEYAGGAVGSQCFPDKD